MIRSQKIKLSTEEAHRRRLERAQRWRKENPGRIKESARLWRLKNKDKMAAYGRTYRKKHPALCKARRAAYYQKHKEHLYEQPKRERKALKALNLPKCISCESIIVQGVYCAWCIRTYHKEKVLKELQDRNLTSSL